MGAPGSTACAAYDALAPAYDLLTADYAHEPWLASLEVLAAEHGLGGRRVLDVACGTGKSFLPLLERGYEVTGCDISSAMLERARAKAPAADLVQADMRTLPALGDFDLVTCLDDALNYLATDQDLLAALRGMTRSLAPAGLALWDVNTQAMYRGDFSRTWSVEADETLVLWRGDAAEDFAIAGMAEAVVDVFEAGPGGWHRTTSSHRQRHWPASTVLDAARTAGLRVLAVRGQHHGGRLERRLDEELHPKAVFLASRDDRSGEEVRTVSIGRP